MINLLFAATLALGTGLSSIIASSQGHEGEVIAKTGSMLPNVPIDSKLVVDESIYSLRPPERFDIVVIRRDFRNPGDSGPTYHKVVVRVVALPGESISIRRGNLYINGRRIKETFPTKPCPREVDEAFPCREMPAVRIPPGHYFLLADNRAESEDSRLWSPKTVPRIDLLGKVVRIILPTADRVASDFTEGPNNWLLKSKFEIAVSSDRKADRGSTRAGAVAVFEQPLRACEPGDEPARA